VVFQRPRNATSPSGCRRQAIALDISQRLPRHFGAGRKRGKRCANHDRKSWYHSRRRLTDVSARTRRPQAKRGIRPRLDNMLTTAKLITTPR
jgi:hypothetical protein